MKRDRNGKLCYFLRYLSVHIRMNSHVCTHFTVLSREEQVSSPTLSYSSEGSYTPSAPFSKKLDFTDDAGPDPTRGNQETKFQQAITPQRESTPVKDMTNGMPLKQTTMPPKQGMMPPGEKKKHVFLTCKNSAKSQEN